MRSGFKSSPNPNPRFIPNPTQVLYAQWLQLSGVLKEDGLFDDAAYRAKVRGRGRGRAPYPDPDSNPNPDPYQVAMATREKMEADRAWARDRVGIRVS